MNGVKIGTQVKWGELEGVVVEVKHRIRVYFTDVNDSDWFDADELQIIPNDSKTITFG